MNRSTKITNSLEATYPEATSPVGESAHAVAHSAQVQDAQVHDAEVEAPVCRIVPATRSEIESSSIMTQIEVAEKEMTSVLDNSHVVVDRAAPGDTKKPGSSGHVVAPIHDEEPSSPFLKLDHFLSTYFYRIGLAAGRRPWAFIAGTFVFALICLSGWSQKDDEERPERLWIPENAQSLTDVDWTDKEWPSYQRMELAIFECENGCNLLTKAHLETLWARFYAIDQVEISGDKVKEIYNSERGVTSGPWDQYSGTYVYDFTTTKPDTATRSRKCFERFGQCVRSDVFEILNADRSDPNWVANNIANDADLLAKLNAYDWGGPNKATLGSVFGKVSTSGGAITKAGLMMARWEVALEPFEDPDDGNRRKVPVEFWWEAEAMCILGYSVQADRDKITAENNCDSNKLPSPLRTYLYFGRSLTDEFRRTLSSDIGRIGMAIVLIIFYLILTLGKRDRVHSMFALSLAIVVGIMMAAAGGLGLSYWFGIKNCVLSNNVYFLILGLGVRFTLRFILDPVNFGL